MDGVPGEENWGRRGKVPTVEMDVQNRVPEVLRRKMGAPDTGHRIEVLERRTETGP